jgi:sulfite exporter TauE/SafE
MGPYLVSTDGSPNKERWSSVPGALRTLAWYHLGRFFAYLGAGLCFGWLARSGAAFPPTVQALAHLLVAGVLAFSLFRSVDHPHCPHKGFRHPGAFAVGLLQGISPCPPFFVAAGLSLSASRVLPGVLLFLSLFLSTALFTLPLAFLEPLRRRTWTTWAMRGLGVLICLTLVGSAWVILRR